MDPLDLNQYSTELKPAANGIWYSSKAEKISYPSSGNQSCFAVEDNSFWFGHRNECIIELLQVFPPPDSTLFDIGGGNGYVSAGLIQSGLKVILVEPGPQGAVNAQTRGVQNIICSTVDQARFKPESLPAVGLFDVIEHIEHDVDFLKKLFNLIQPGGLIYFTVPSYKALWSAEDVYAGHYRRHTQTSLKTVVEQAGFKVVYTTYFFQFLILPIFLLRALPYKLGLVKEASKDIASNHASNNQGPLKKLTQKILRREISYIKNRTSMSFGASILLVAKK